MFKVDDLIVLDPYPGADVNAAQIYRYIMSRKDLGPVPVPKTYAHMTEEGYVHLFSIAAVEVAVQFQIRVSGFVGQIFHETNVLRFGNDVHPDQLNFGGIGATGGGVPGHTFPTVRHGLTVNAEHLLVYALGKQDRWPGVLSTRKIFDPRYGAVISMKWDGSSPLWSGLAGKWADHIGTYKKGIEKHANGVIAMDNRPITEGESPLLRVAIASGHHNNQGGNPTEIEVVPEITERMFYHLNRTPGIECRSLTPDGPDDDDLPGDGTVNLTIYAKWSQTLAQWSKEGFVPDLCIEEHTQGVGNTSVRGWFGIYPSMNGDVDVDVRDKLIPAIRDSVKQHTPWPIWTDGVMAEHETGVGAQGHRLGYFSATAYLKEHTERVLFENGAHTNPDDLNLLRDKSKVDTLCQAKVAAICSYYGIDYTWEKVHITPKPQSFTSNVTGKKVVLGFLDRWNSIPNQFLWRHVGHPLTDEFSIPWPDGTTRSAQIFEKDVWTWQPGPENPDDRIQSVFDYEADYVTGFARLKGLL